MAGDGHGHRGERQDDPGRKARWTPEPPTCEVIDQTCRGHAHQCLGHEHAERMEAEDPRRQRLHPESQRRLVDGHQAAGIHRGPEEVVPAAGHRADRRGVEGVGPAVDAQSPEVEDAGHAQHAQQLGSRPQPVPDRGDEARRAREPRRAQGLAIRDRVRAHRPRMRGVGERTVRDAFTAGLERGGIRCRSRLRPPGLRQAGQLRRGSGSGSACRRSPFSWSAGEAQHRGPGEAAPKTSIRRV